MSKILKKHISVLILYTALVLLMTLPVVLKLTTHVAGSGGDPWQTMWRFEDRLSAAQAARDNSQLGPFIFREFLGGGEPRLINNSVWPWMGLHTTLGEPLAYNVVWLLSYIMSGFTMWLLTRCLIPANRTFSILNFKLANNDIAAIMAGILYMFAPYHTAHSFGHFGAMQTQWLPLAILLTLLFKERQTFIRALGLVVVLTIQSWSEHHYLLWYALFVSLYLAWHWQYFRQLTLKRSKVLLQTSFVILLLILVLLPWWPTARLAFSGQSSLVLGSDQTIRFSADLFSYIIPASFHPIWGDAANTLFAKKFTGNVSEATHFLGWVPLLLVLFFHQRIPRKHKIFWGVATLIFGIISLGPRLHIIGHILPIPLPWALIDSWPVFNAVRAVGRASVIVLIAFCILFGWVVATQIKRPIIFILIGTVILLEFLFMPVPLQSAILSDVYKTAAKLPGSTIIELPAATNYTAASRALYAEGIHRKSVIGNIALERSLGNDILEEIRSMPALRQLLYLRTTDLQARRPDFFNQELKESLADTLRKLDVGGIIIHLDSLSASQVRITRDFLEQDIGFRPQPFQDAILYEVPQSFRDSGDGIFISRDNQWVNVRSDIERGTEASVVHEASIRLFNTKNKVTTVDLSYTVDSSLSDPLNISVGNNGGSDVYLRKDNSGRYDFSIAIPANSRVIISFRNNMTQPATIFDPRFIVAR